MKKSEIAALPLPKLLQLQAEIEETLVHKRKEAADALRAQLSKMAADAGFRLEAVLGDKHIGRRTAAIRYRDPSNPDNVWSGRGRPARWIAAYLRQGKKLEQFRVS